MFIEVKKNTIGYLRFFHKLKVDYLTLLTGTISNASKLVTFNELQYFLTV